MRNPGIKDDDRVNLSEPRCGGPPPRCSLAPAVGREGADQRHSAGVCRPREMSRPSAGGSRGAAGCFDDSVSGPKPDLDYSSFLFNSLLGHWLGPQIVGWVPKLRERLPGFAKDAAVYEQQTSRRRKEARRGHGEEANIPGTRLLFEASGRKEVTRRRRSRKGDSYQGLGTGTQRVSESAAAWLAATGCAVSSSFPAPAEDMVPSPSCPLAAVTRGRLRHGSCRL